MEINRRTVLAGAAVAPFVPGVAGAVEPESEGNLYFLAPEEWFCRVGDDGVVTIGAYAFEHKDGTRSYRHVLFHPDDKISIRASDGTTYQDGTLFPAHTRYEGEKFAGMNEDVNHEEYLKGRKFTDTHPPKA